MVANSDKRLAQFIATEMIGQLNAWPVIKKPVFKKNRQSTETLSGKIITAENVGGFFCNLEVKVLSDSDDLDVIEELYDSGVGFLVWLSGGDESQFRSVRKGYRLQDLFLMRCMNDYTPQWNEGLYKTGLNIDMQLAEVIF